MEDIFYKLRTIMKYIFFFALCAIILSSCKKQNEGYSNGTNSQELIPFEKKGKWRFMDADKNVILTPQYDEVKAFHEGVAVVKLGDVYGYINQQGLPVVGFKFSEAFDFKDGKALVRQKDTDQIGFIDKEGVFTIAKGLDNAMASSKNHSSNALPSKSSQQPKKNTQTTTTVYQQPNQSQNQNTEELLRKQRELEERLRNEQQNRQQNPNNSNTQQQQDAQRREEEEKRQQQQRLEEERRRNEDQARQQQQREDEERRRAEQERREQQQREEQRKRENANKVEQIAREVFNKVGQKRQ